MGGHESPLPEDDSSLASATAASLEVPGGWIVDFDLPYFVSVVDSMDDPVLRAYADAVEAGGTPEPVPYSPRPRLDSGAVLGGATLHLPDLATLGETFEVPVGSGAVKLSFLRRVRNVDRSVVMFGELRPDSGAASFSSVRAHFNVDLSATFESNGLGLVADAALRAVNRFLVQYRYYTGSYWAYSVDKADVVEFLIQRLFHDGRAPGPPAVHTAPSGGPLWVGGSRPLVDPGLDAAIRTALAAGQESPLEFEVLLSAQEHVHRRRYRNAVVDAATAFEIYLAGFLRFHLAAKGRSSAEIDAVFLDDSGRYLSVTMLAKHTLRDELGIDFAGTSAYRDWKINVNGIRNAVIHRGARPTRVAAEDAIRNTDRARAKLLELLPSEPGTGTSQTGAEERATT